ncbi:MAG: GNAT family N-acetyltransferase [Lachnospiraceae bacterium]|nr:GNAT family N-acetyltransferase [Lachnospiraceae bacterium]
MDKIKKLSELDENQVNQALNVFIEGFYNIMSAITKDKEKLHRLFKNSFNYDITYAYLQNGEAVGFLGLGNYQKRALNLNKDIFTEILPEKLPTFAGKSMYKAMYSSMCKPHNGSPEEIYIDFIATNPEYRSTGIGTKLIKFIRGDLSYKTIGLDVMTKNPRAKKFYERMGFKVIKTKLDLMARLQGFGGRIIMKWEAEK